jgi:hypothetical protein
MNIMNIIKGVFTVPIGEKEGLLYAGMLIVLLLIASYKFSIM